MSKSCSECKEDALEFVTCWDNPDSGFAFNVYLCENCGTLLKEDVWKNAGRTIIHLNGDVTKT